MKKVILKRMWRVGDGGSPGSYPPFCLGPEDGVAIGWDRKARQSGWFGKNDGEFSGVVSPRGVIDGMGGQVGG